MIEPRDNVFPGPAVALDGPDVGLYLHVFIKCETKKNLETASGCEPVKCCLLANVIRP